MGTKSHNKPKKSIFYSLKEKLELKYVKDIVKDSYVKFTKRNSFCVFNSIYDIFYLIYLTEKNSIVFFDIIDNKEIIKIKKAHKANITNIRHCVDNNNRRDLIITISLEDNNIKLWNVNNFECLVNLKNIYNQGRLFAGCFLNDNNQIYIITSNNNSNKPFKVFDLKGKIIKEINILNSGVEYIDIFYERKKSKIYILTCEKDSVKSYDYINNKIYKIYKEFETPEIDYLIHTCLTINNNEELIESCYDGCIRIWNFHSAKLLKVIRITKERYALRCFCLWDNKYLFAGCQKRIEIVQFEDGYIVNELIGHNNDITYIIIINHPKYGKCLISQCYYKGEIKLFIKSS